MASVASSLADQGPVVARCVAGHSLRRKCVLCEPAACDGRFLLGIVAHFIRSEAARREPHTQTGLTAGALPQPGACLFCACPRPAALQKRPVSMSQMSAAQVPP